MIEYNDVHIEADKFQIGVQRVGATISALLKDHVDDLAREVQQRASDFAPRGPTGRLKAAGTIKSFRDDITGDNGIPSGAVVTDISSFGGGRAVRGPGGRFVAASKLEEGHVFSGALTNHNYTAVVQLNPAVKHAVWVHEGTGLFGPYHSPIAPRKAKYLVFYWHGRKWMKKSVRGQQAQPFLTEAFEYVSNVYEPAKISQLRAEIAAST